MSNNKEVIKSQHYSHVCPPYLPFFSLGIVSVSFPRSRGEIDDSGSGPIGRRQRRRRGGARYRATTQMTRIEARGQNDREHLGDCGRPRALHKLGAG